MPASPPQHCGDAGHGLPMKALDHLLPGWFPEAHPSRSGIVNNCVYCLAMSGVLCS